MTHLQAVKKINAELEELRKEKKLDFAVIMLGPKAIDEHGISKVIVEAIARGIKKLQLEKNDCFIKLDGSLKAPKEFKQETIIKGDDKEKVIGLASILAKETRDIYMTQLSKNPEYEVYNFAQHKGYGTKAHREAIKTHGVSNIHRISYCSRCT